MFLLVNFGCRPILSDDKIQEALFYLICMPFKFNTFAVFMYMFPFQKLEIFDTNNSYVNDRSL